MISKANRDVLDKRFFNEFWMTWQRSNHSTVRMWYKPLTECFFSTRPGLWPHQYVLLSPLYKQANWGMAWVSNLLKVLQTGSDGAGCWTQCWLRRCWPQEKPSTLCEIWSVGRSFWVQKILEMPESDNLETCLQDLKENIHAPSWRSFFI